MKEQQLVIVTEDNLKKINKLLMNGWSTDFTVSGSGGSTFLILYRYVRNGNANNRLNTTLSGSALLGGLHFEEVVAETYNDTILDQVEGE